MSALSAIFVLKENGTQSHSAIFLNWGDHVNSVPDLSASPPLMFTLYTGQLSVPTQKLFTRADKLLATLENSSSDEDSNGKDHTTVSRGRQLSVPTQKLFSIVWTITRFDSPLQRSAKRSLTPLQKPRQNHRYYVFTEAVSGMVSVRAPKRSGVV